MMNSLIERWRHRARALKTEIYAIYLAYKDPRTPWLAKFVALCVVAYACSPIDLIPDFIPVLGYMDDVFLLPLGILLAVKLIPPAVYGESKAKALQKDFNGTSTKWIAAFTVAIIWVTGGFFIAQETIKKLVD